MHFRLVRSCIVGGVTALLVCTAYLTLHTLGEQSGIKADKSLNSDTVNFISSLTLRNTRSGRQSVAPADAAEQASTVASSSKGIPPPSPPKFGAQKAQTPSNGPLRMNYDESKPVAQQSEAISKELLSLQQKNLRERVKQTTAIAARILLYTMDSITSYGAAATKGGPAGEILVRHCLTAALESLGFTVDTVGSDDAFFSAGKRIEQYRYIVVDPWTIYGKGWTPRPFLVGREADTYVLDFFGAPALARGGGLGISPSHLLTASPTPWNTFLGFFFPPHFPSAPSGGATGLRELLQAVREQGQECLMKQHLWQKSTEGNPREGWAKSRQDLQAAWSDAPPPRLQGGGVIWGKQPSYLATQFAKEAVMSAAGHAVLGSTASQAPAWLQQLQDEGGVKLLSHLSPDTWRQLLCSNAFLLGLGDPLAGPSAWEAVACGATFVDVLYAPGKAKGVQGSYRSQHPWVSKWAPARLVCTAQEVHAASAGECAQKSMLAREGGERGGFIPQQLTAEAYLMRVQAIFGLAAESASPG